MVEVEIFYYDNILQDYKIHRDEIHTKLVQIMRERLLANLRKLPQIVEDWNKEDADPQPSSFAKSVTKVLVLLMLSPSFFSLSFCCTIYSPSSNFLFLFHLIKAYSVFDLQEVSFLHRILSQTLLESDVQAIFRYYFIQTYLAILPIFFANLKILTFCICKFFSYFFPRQVVQIFHTNITDAFSKLELRTPQANNRYVLNLKLTQVQMNLYF